MPSLGIGKESLFAVHGLICNVAVSISIAVCSPIKIYRYEQVTIMRKWWREWMLIRRWRKVNWLGSIENSLHYSSCQVMAVVSKQVTFCWWLGIYSYSSS